MRIPRIHTQQPLQEYSETLTLDSDTSHYLVQVLRLRAEAELILFNGDGHDYHARLLKADKRQAGVATLERSIAEPPTVLPIHLGLALSKGERLEFALQKAVELGVTEISLLDTDYNAVKLDAERLQKKFRHWQKILIAACEQSGRKRLPLLHPLSGFADWSRQADAGLKLLLHPRSEKHLPDFDRPAAVRLLVGPEGGFSDQEVLHAEQQGFQTVALGSHVLRTETAPLAAIAAMQVLWGDFRASEK